MSNQLPIENCNGNNAYEVKQNAKTSIVSSHTITSQATPSQDNAPKSDVVVAAVAVVKPNEVKYKLWSEYPQD